MFISKDIKDAASKSVLCWLATVDGAGLPNVSPKEIFNIHQDKFIIANIMSPVSEQNIKSSPLVCVSFVDILVQKGFQLKGRAEIIEKTNERYLALNSILEEMTKGLFPISNIISIDVSKVKKILAPSYVFYPEKTSETEQIKAAKAQYNL